MASKSRVTSFALACSFAACFGAVEAKTPQPRALAVADALNLYARGRYAEFFEAISRDGAVDRNLFKIFERDANRWIGGADADPQRRTIVAATVALEIAHRLRDEPADRAARYFVWASLRMRAAPPPIPSETERLWYLASIAGMEELDEPWALTTGDRTGSSVLDPIRRPIEADGVLALASKRFPQEPRFQLARVEASEDGLIDACEVSLVSARFDAIKARAAAPVSHVPQSFADRWDAGQQYIARASLQVFSRIPGIARSFQILANDPGLRGEVDLPLGYLAAGVADWSVALDHLHRVPLTTDETFLRYLSHYFIGRVFQARGDHAAAVGAFEQALRILPNARSAATLLAAELLLSDDAADRDRAYPLLQGAYSETAPDDPWRLYGHGDARLWPVYMAQLRQALQ